MRESAAEARKDEAELCTGEQLMRRERAREPAAERDRNNFSDEIRGLNPAQLVERRVQRGRDSRQRGGNDLNVQNRHEKPEAHRREAKPRAATRLFAARRANRYRAQARSSVRMRHHSIAMFSASKRAAR